MTNVEQLRRSINSYATIRVEVTPDQSAHWLYQHADIGKGVRPCFRTQLMEDMWGYLTSITLRESQREPGRLRHLVLASDAPAFNLGGDLELFAELIRSNNRQKLLEYARRCVDGVYHFHNGLGGDVRTIALVQGDALGGGLAQLGGVIPDYFDQELPTAQWFTGLLGVLSPASPHGFLQGSLAADEFFKQPAVEAEFAEHNLKVVSAAVTEPYSLLCTKPSETLAQTTGLRARTAGATRNAELAALGLTAVNLPPDDVYDGMQRGVIDCTVAAKSLMSTYGLWEVAPYFTPVGITPALRVNAMNLDVWNALPPDVQKVMMDAVPTYIAGIVRAELDAYAKLFGPDGPAANGTDPNRTALSGTAERLPAVRSGPVSGSERDGWRSPASWADAGPVSSRPGPAGRDRRWAVSRGDR